MSDMIAASQVTSPAEAVGIGMLILSVVFFVVWWMSKPRKD
jgi:hypothetical protein